MKKYYLIKSWNYAENKEFTTTATAANLKKTIDEILRNYSDITAITYFFGEV